MVANAVKPPVEKTIELLTDEQMRQFITQGYLILNTNLSEGFHNSLTSQLNHVYEKEGNPGNNLLPRIREMHQIFDDPVIVGALTSVLGPDYMMHAHRHGHFNAVNKPGAWHKDSYWGYKRMRNHHLWWAMIMYFPQDTPVELGPTGVFPGTQYYETRTFAKDEVADEALASGNAGTFALIHYDIWHRSTANLLGNPRFMLKFEFMRTKAPTEPSWNNQDEEWKLPQNLNAPIAQHDVLWQETWNWLSGRPCSLAKTLSNDSGTVNALSKQLEEPYEPDALNAAYELACSGSDGVRALLNALENKDVRVSRTAAYGLSIVGQDAVEGLTDALDSQRPETVSHAVFALGELGSCASEAMTKLTQLLHHPSERVRREVVEALGKIGTPVDIALSGLIRGLKDEDVQVRFMSALSITHFGSAAKEAVPFLQEALDDDNRYVRAHALEALRYIGTEQAKDLLIKTLMNSRWCTTTTPESTFYP